MLFAGHMILAYFINQALKKKVSLCFSLPLLFSASILPDLDFLFSPIVPHHTLTHSLTFWSLICLSLIIIKRRIAIPYVIAILSHFLIGDIITGNPTIFYGLSNQTFGNIRSDLSLQFGTEFGALYQATVEAVMVALFLAYAISRFKIPSIFSFPIKHVLFFGLVLLLILIGTLKSQILYVVTNPNAIIYFSYAIIVTSQTIFAAVVTRGTNKISLQQITRTDS
jgi:hypothetical protein